MKRSELYSILDQVISQSKLSESSDTQLFKRIREMEQELAEDILSKVEENLKITHEVPIGKAFNYDIDDSEYFHRNITCQGWEQEDG